MRRLVFTLLLAVPLVACANPPITQWIGGPAAAAGDPYEISFHFASTFGSGAAIVNSGTEGDGTAGTTPACPTWVDVSGDTSAHTSYDGGDMINANYAPTISSSASFTVMAWVQSSEYSQTGSFLGGVSGNNEISILYGDGTVSNITTWVVDSDGTALWTYSSNVKKDTWYHFALTVNRASPTTGLKTYLNKTQTYVLDITALGEINLSARSFYVGAINVNGTVSYNWHGKIDSVIIDVEKAWSSTEIGDYYDDTKAAHP